jgi:crotonobetainyl-CoA:carnitine CoA-transferase CaiB-like acyl-CoA transferase
MRGTTVVDLSRGTAGPIATMLLADSGALVTKVTRPGGDPFAGPASLVWDRGKQTVDLDLRSEEGKTRFRSLLETADVLVDAFAPRTREQLDLGPDLLDSYPRLVHCSITAYGARGARRDRPGYDALVQARTGLMHEQPGLRQGPIFHWSPLPSYGAGLLAACGILAALRERERSGAGQEVATSLLQGVLAFTTIPWSRVERPPTGYSRSHGCRDVGVTPCFETGDGSWIHPMHEAVPLALESLGVAAGDLSGSEYGTCEERKLWQASVQELLLQKTGREWLELCWDRDIRCQPVLSVSESFQHEQLAAIEAIEDRHVEGVGSVRQFGQAFRVTPRAGPEPVPVPTEAPRLAAPLTGLTVLDFGLAVAGPYAPMLLSDLGADVIRVDNVKAPRATDNQVWAACQRGKRSITLDLKSAEGRAVADKLIATADVIHHNMRPGVAERLGIGYEDVYAVNPGVVYCHVTGFGSTGPLAAFPGCDQMGQALSGLEHEQGATPAGGHPTWNRLGIGDHTAAILSVVGTLEALHRRERTGEGALVEANITTAAAFLTSHAAISSGERFPELDIEQTGLSPLYRLYGAAEGWLCLAAVGAPHWQALCEALGLPELVSDPRFIDSGARQRNAAALSNQLSGVFRAKPADEWVSLLDSVGVPAEVVSDSFNEEWFDDPDLIGQGWVARYDHPTWGRTEQLGRLWDFSATPARLFGPPVMHGQHSREILAGLGYGEKQIEQLAAHGITTLPGE